MVGGTDVAMDTERLPEIERASGPSTSLMVRWLIQGARSASRWQRRASLSLSHLDLDGSVTLVPELSPECARTCHKLRWVMGWCAVCVF